MTSNKYYYLFYTIKNDGIYEKKIKAQIEALREDGIEVQHVRYIPRDSSITDVFAEQNSKIQYSRRDLYRYKNTLLEKLERMFNLVKHQIFYIRLLKYLNDEGIQVLYVRKYYFTSIDCFFFKRVSKIVKKLF